jgi:HAE1 family hydrophobic/amphiphilic exporter-1
MLIGIVKKNAIMQIVSRSRPTPAQQDARRSVYEGCVIRSRPIMMTTMAALLDRCRSRWAGAGAGRGRWVSRSSAGLLSSS